MRRHPLIYYCLSGILLALCTPSIGYWPLAFVAFVPLLYALEDEFELGQVTYGSIFFKGLLTGFFYYASIFLWIVSFSLLSLILMITVYACLYGLFAMGTLLGLKAGLKGVFLSIWIGCLWVSLEMLGSDLFLPIISCAVGYLLWESPVLIQVADITGVFGVSFWIVCINILIVRWIRDGFKFNVSWTLFVLVITLFLIGYGFLKHSPNPGFAGGDSVSVSLLYTASTIKEKREPDFKKKIFKLLKEKTLNFIDKRNEQSDLFVWPETSVPVFLRSVSEKEFIEGLLNLAKKTDISILMGARTIIKEDNGEVKKYNSAFLVPPKGYVAQEYHKILLTPFVEMNPLESLLPKRLKKKWQSKFDAGKELGIMELDSGCKFGAIICYETLMPDFVRQVAGKGASFIVSITNDVNAFGDNTPAYASLIPHAVYRAVESRRFLVRCANWSKAMVISPQGDIIQSSLVGSTGCLSSKIVPMLEKTFLTRHGFIFAKVLLFITLFWSILLIKRVILDDQVFSRTL